MKIDIIIKNSKKMCIIQDSREKPKWVHDKVTIEKLDIADYYIESKNVLIERKTALDFIQSYLNKKLYNQLLTLQKSNSDSYLVIECDM